MQIISPHIKDLGGFQVRRLLPSSIARSVGPFVFLDHMGPHIFSSGQGMDVRPHPHIGLATVTYLFEGGIVHRDSLGYQQRIAPGDVNWMTAGHGIVHSERSDALDRARGFRLHGLQTWIALPQEIEQTAPSFTHIPKNALPVIHLPGVEMRILAGNYSGQHAPTPVHSPTLYVAIEAQAGTVFTLTSEHDEQALYIVSGNVLIQDRSVPAEHLALLPSTQDHQVTCRSAAQLMLLGGQSLGPRYMWWNFVTSDRSLIDQAKHRWLTQSMGQIPGETEFIPLPEK